MKKLIWNYTMALAKPVEVKHTNGSAPEAFMTAPAWHAIINATAGMEDPKPLRAAIRAYALAFARERLAYRFGVGDKAVTNIARIKAQRELFAQLEK
nr:MAG TPA: hypothetical protein [Caudoviricetes sp.]